MSISLEAHEILMHLNRMGYRNITAEQLREFIKDLKRLIKYESKYSNIETAINTLSAASLQSRTNEVLNNFDKLHITSTAASRAKCSKRNEPPARKTNADANKENINRVCRRTAPEPMPKPVHKVTRKPSWNDCTSPCNIPEIEIRQSKSRQCSARQCSARQCSARQCSARQSSAKTPTSIPTIVQPCIRNTPTDLYQHYQQDWDRFKNLLPGENSRSNVRSAIRKKMERKPQPNKKLYLIVNEDQTKEFKRM